MRNWTVFAIAGRPSTNRTGLAEVSSLSPRASFQSNGLPPAPVLKIGKEWHVSEEKPDYPFIHPSLRPSIIYRCLSYTGSRGGAGTSPSCFCVNKSPVRHIETRDLPLAAAHLENSDSPAYLRMLTLGSQMFYEMIVCSIAHIPKHSLWIRYNLKRRVNTNDRFAEQRNKRCADRPQVRGLKPAACGNKSSWGN